MALYRVGLIGCGRIGSEFEDLRGEHPCSIAGAFNALPNCQLVAGCNRGEERLRKFGRRWGVTSLYRDHAEMLRNEQLDLVAVATPPGAHRDQVVAAAEAGAKGIFCEKPMALSLAECDDMLAACRQNGAKLLVNCTRRWIGQYEAVKRAAGVGRWGELLHLVGFCQGCKPLPEWEAEFEDPCCTTRFTCSISCGSTPATWSGSSARPRGEGDRSSAWKTRACRSSNLPRGSTVSSWSTS